MCVVQMSNVALALNKTFCLSVSVYMFFLADSWQRLRKLTAA